jgi:hypothetical protein
VKIASLAGNEDEVNAALINSCTEIASVLQLPPSLDITCKVKFGSTGRRLKPGSVDENGNEIAHVFVNQAPSTSNFMTAQIKNVGETTVAPSQTAAQMRRFVKSGESSLKSAMSTIGVPSRQVSVAVKEQRVKAADVQATVEGTISLRISLTSLDVKKTMSNTAVLHGVEEAVANGIAGYGHAKVKDVLVTLLPSADKALQLEAYVTISTVDQETTFQSMMDALGDTGADGFTLKDVSENLKRVPDIASVAGSSSMVLTNKWLAIVRGDTVLEIIPPTSAPTALPTEKAPTIVGHVTVSLTFDALNLADLDNNMQDEMKDGIRYALGNRTGSRKISVTLRAGSVVAISTIETSDIGASQVRLANSAAVITEVTSSVGATTSLTSSQLKVSTIEVAVVPTAAPTVAPTVEPTWAPTAGPSVAPTHHPTVAPTVRPTATPTVTPTSAPTYAPTSAPTDAIAQQAAADDGESADIDPAPVVVACALTVLICCIVGLPVAVKYCRRPVDKQIVDPNKVVQEYEGENQGNHLLDNVPCGGDNDLQGQKSSPDAVCDEPLMTADLPVAAATTAPMRIESNESAGPPQTALSTGLPASREDAVHSDLSADRAAMPEEPCVDEGKGSEIRGVRIEHLSDDTFEV